ncbi:unnamed protein product [Psylliodes chrysocephalus]|uniref:Uncharacterized protein n=1 Tax=Psylliodes chrysocephalus TaxID=3402493 RepID=A0A9P0CHX3_9CUCU|nr:unnamed protein product [Psylliodes chrysocephala]
MLFKYYSRSANGHFHSLLEARRSAKTTADTTKDYIDGGKSVADLHRDYVANCKARNVLYGNYVLYHRIFTSEYNINFFQPKKDQCEDCTASEEENAILKQKYEEHQEEKKHDKNNTDYTCVVAMYDLQGTLPCPRGEVSNFYYVSNNKLNTINFTVYDIKIKRCSVSSGMKVKECAVSMRLVPVYSNT